MADNVVDQPAQAAPDARATANAELAQMMANNGVIPQPAEQVVVEQPAAAEVVKVEPEVVNLPFQTFKEKFGYEKPDDIYAEIETYRKSKSELGREFEFANDDSAELFKAFTLGDKNAVRDYLQKEQRINELVALEVTKDTAADIVKFGMQLKYGNLTSQEIEYKFNKQFSMPAKPAQGADEEEPEYQDRVNQWQTVVSDRQMELMIEAKMAKPDIDAAKKNLVLPKYVAPVDDSYAQYQQMLDEQTKLAQEAEQFYKTLSPKALETKIKFTDEANKIDFEFQFEPDTQGFGKTIEMASDIEKFWQAFTKPDGTPDRIKFADAIYFALNKERVISEAMKQAKNAAIKATLPDNSTGGLVRQMAQPQEGEENELDKQMRLAGIRRN